MKIFGHPLHLMLIHFPSALLPTECACYGILYYTGNISFASAAFFSMTGGVVLGWLAIIFGVMDLIKIPSSKSEVMAKGIIHGSINTTVILVYTLLAWMLFKKYPELPPANGLLFIIKISLIIFMIAGNYLGGNLVLKYKIGMEK